MHASEGQGQGDGEEVSDVGEITARVKELRGKLTSGIKRQGNFGWAKLILMI